MRYGKYLIHLPLERGGRSANGPARSGRPDDKLGGSRGSDNLLTACITPQGNSRQPAHLRCDSRCFASALLEQYGGRRPPVPPPPGEGERKRSRGAPLRPSYERPRHVTLRNRHHRTLIRWSMLSYSRQMPVGAFARAASATARTNGKNERKRFGGETPTDATVVRRAETGTAAPPYGRRTSIGVPPRFLLRRPNATAQLQSALPGMGARKRALSANRPVSVQRSSSQTGRSAGRAGTRSRPGAFSAEPHARRSCSAYRRVDR